MSEQEKKIKKWMRKKRTELWTYLSNWTDRQDIGQTKREIVLEILGCPKET